MAYIIITDDWYTGYQYDEWKPEMKWKPHGVLHEVPDEILAMFEAVGKAAVAMQDLLELMDKSAREPRKFTPPEWAHQICPECGVTWDTPSPACPKRIYNRHPLVPYPKP